MAALGTMNLTTHLDDPLLGWAQFIVLGRTLLASVSQEMKVAEARKWADQSRVLSKFYPNEDAQTTRMGTVDDAGGRGAALVRTIQTARADTIGFRVGRTKLVLPQVNRTAFFAGAKVRMYRDVTEIAAPRAWPSSMRLEHTESDPALA